MQVRTWSKKPPSSCFRTASRFCDRATIACDWDDTISLRCRYDCSLNIETHECGSLIADAVACGLDKPVICQGNDEYIVEGCDDELMAVGTCFEENDSGG